MTIRLQFDRIPPGVEIGPHRHGQETIVYVAGGELVYEHGEGLERKCVVGAGDILYEAAAEWHLVRNTGMADALALLASSDVDGVDDTVRARRWVLDDEPVRRAAGARVTDVPGVRRRLIAEPGDFGSSTFTVGEIEIGPGAAIDWHRHLEAEHALVVFEGRGVVSVGGIEETLEPLKGIRIVPGLAHRIENTGRRPLRYYVCGSPGIDPLVDREQVEAPGRRREA